MFSNLFRLSLGELASRIRDLMILSSFVISLASLVGFVVWKAYQNEIRESARSFLGVDALATKDQVQSLVDSLAKATGEDRMIRMEEIYSYVIEPVSAGEDITARYVLSRTERGASCVVTDAVPLFVDDRNTPMPGSIVSPLQQLTTRPTPIEATLRPPMDLREGRVCVAISLTYDCAGHPVFDQIDPICYILQP